MIEVRHIRIVRSVLLGTAASLTTLGAAQAADLPLKARPIEYVKVCAPYGAGFWFIPGTDTCLRISGGIRIGTTFNGAAWDVPFFQGGTGGANAYGRNYFATRSRVYTQFDTRTQTEYGVLRTYANLLMDWTQGTSAIAGGNIVEIDAAFIQFAGFTLGKSVSEFDPQWALTKPIIGTTTGALSGSHNDTGIPQFAYTADFGNGVSGTVSLEDGQPYRTAGVVNTSLTGANALTGPFGATTLPTGAIGVASFPGNAVAGDHVPDVVGNLRLDQGWGTLHFAAAAHEVHGTYYMPTDSEFGHPDATWGYAVIGAFELKNLPTGSGDSLKFQASYGNGAAKYIFGGAWDTAGAGRLAKINGTSLGFGYVLDGLYGAGTNITKSEAWQAAGFYEHYWNPAWRTSVFASYSHIGYGAAGDALLLAAANGGGLTTGTTAASGSFNLGLGEIGTRTAWMPVKDMTLALELTYVRLFQHLNGTFTTTGTAIPGFPAGSTFTLGDQNLYQGAVEARRNF
jgi:hypothetical protein